MQNRQFCTQMSRSFFNRMSVLSLCHGNSEDKKCQKDTLNPAVHLSGMEHSDT